MNIERSTRLAMAHKGIKTQAEAAQICNLGAMTISKILSGKGFASEYTIVQLSKGFELKVSEFIALGEE